MLQPLQNISSVGFRNARSPLGRALRWGWPAILLLAFGCSSENSGGSTHTTLASKDGGDTNAGPEPVLPAAPAECPVLQTGTINVLGQDVQLWVGEKQPDKKGPVLFYWHGTGSVAEEIQAFMQPQLDEIVAEGGIAASFTTSTTMGDNTGNLVWYTGDYDMADIILACAVKQLNIDTRRIYAAGCSAGGLQAGTMVFARSSYLAASMPNSGGDIFLWDFQDPSHVPAVMTAHGTYDADFVVVHFSEMSMLLDQAVSDAGGVAIDCNHGGGHCGDPPQLVAAQWQFLKDHPFGFAEDPYANGLPSSFPSYCVQVPPSRDQ